jgi:hypothetical protein
MCLYPKLIKNRKYVANKKNNQTPPIAKDKRVLYVPVGCGKCMECRKQKARQWQVRLQEDIRVNKNAKFVTYTFSERELQKLDNEVKGLTGYDRDNEVCRLAVRRYTERWRKKYGKTLRHWLVTELGHQNTERVHMHGIVWTDEVKDIKKIWKYGWVWIGDYVSAKTINYIVKYVNKVDEKHKEYNSKIYTSKGIGRNYMERRDVERNKYKAGKTIETYKTRQGIEIALPIYYRNKIYKDEEKEALWLEKLDEGIRWVNGIKVDIKEGEEEYYKLLEQERMKNKRLGYGDDSRNWELKKYENERRNLKKLERIQKLYGVKPINEPQM